MKAVCAIAVDCDRTFISFAILKKPSFTFFREHILPLPFPETNILAYFHQNVQNLYQAISEVERRYSLRVERVFFELPQEAADIKIVKETVPLRRKKRLSRQDIDFVKKNLEDKFLDWDDFCIHNIILNYQVEGVDYQKPPLGVWTKKVTVESILIGIKDRIYKEFEDTFDNFGKHFDNFVIAPISIYASAFPNLDSRYLGEPGRRKENHVALRCDYTGSYFVIRKPGNFIFSEKINFGLRDIIEELSKRFFLDFSLAEEVFERYISFKEVPYFKEITVKKEGGYLNLSTQTMNSVIKSYIKTELKNILQRISNHLRDNDCLFCFIGRLNAKEGFSNFLKEFIPYTVIAPLEKSTLSSSFGCLRYGISPFIETEYKKPQSLFQRIVWVYREYF